MKQAQSGDIILVSCGIFKEHDIVFKSGVALWSGTLQPSCVVIDAQGLGPAIQFANADTTTSLVGFTIRGGHQTLAGGALVIKNSSPKISNCIFEDNNAPMGGAIHSDKDSRPSLTNCLFRDNQATRGGALSVHGSLHIRRSSFQANSALLGGAIHLNQEAWLRSIDCSFQNNAAGNSGGALFLVQGMADIQGCLFSSNSGGMGAADLAVNRGDLKIRSCTLVQGKSDVGGSTLAFQSQTSEFQNSILAFGKTDILLPESQTPVFRGCNLFGNLKGDWVSSLDSQRTKNYNISADPLFCAPEFGDFKLRSGSPCLPAHNPSGNPSVVGAAGVGCQTESSNLQGSESERSRFNAVNAGL